MRHSGPGSRTSRPAGREAARSATPETTPTIRPIHRTPGQGSRISSSGIPTSASRYVPPGWYYQRFKNEWAYFNDDWKATPNLTINLGVRYEINWPTTEKYLRFANFSPTARTGKGAIVVPDQASVSRPTYRVRFRFRIRFTSSTRFSRRMPVSMRNTCAMSATTTLRHARLAYRLTSETVIRAGLRLVLGAARRKSRKRVRIGPVPDSRVGNPKRFRSSPRKTMQNFLPRVRVSASLRPAGA